MPYSGPGDATPAPVWQDPTAFDQPVPIVIDPNAASGYYIDPSVYDVTVPVSPGAIYVPPEDFSGGHTPTIADAVDVPDTPTYAAQVVIWGHDPGSPEEAIALYQSDAAGTTTPGYGVSATNQIDHIPEPVIDAIDGGEPHDPVSVMSSDHVISDQPAATIPFLANADTTGVPNTPSFFQVLFLGVTILSLLRGGI